ncbi:uncharacterized protein LOC133196839 [Saccostrea echinata]|uniref:uncharacterized protein LOC133196839 n=1 Tax=Saccostrea echinata TaxID=191078 RepID=UPI002A7F6E28|nr:uncharacterized protein LOC133196839 [Saccostrea echinata]
MESAIAIVQTPTEEFHRRSGFKDIKNIKQSEKPAFLRYCRKHTSSLPSDCKPWKISDITLLSHGRFAIVDTANTRLKIFTPDFVHVTSKIISDDSHSLTGLQEDKIFVMDNTLVSYYLFSEGRLSLEERFELTGMHYDILSDGNVLFLIKLTTLDVRNDQFETLKTIDFKPTLGYTPDTLRFDKNENIIFFNCDTFSIVSWDKFQAEKWRINDVDSCISIHNYGLGWILVGFEDVMFVDLRGRTSVQFIGDPEIEDYRCSVIDCERNKLFLSDKRNVYEYDLEVQNVMK